MMHASTSPLYPIIVSNDITAAMMDGPGGPRSPTSPSRRRWRSARRMGRVHRQFAQKNDWFFRTWNADTVKTSKAGKKVAFEDARPSSSRRDPECWVLHPGETWHGFGDLEDGYCMLDPIKVSIVTPGVADKGGLDKRGIPATLRHLRTCTTAASRSRRPPTSPILFLFSIGITKGKWGTLLNALLDFKRDYDSNAPLGAGPAAPRRPSHPDVYGGLGLRDLADQMFAQLTESRQTHWLAEAFSTLPKPVMTPNAAYQHLVRDEIEHVPLDKLADRVLATSVVPYPPGIPDAHARRVDRRATTVRISATCGRSRRGTSASRASGTTRTASRTGTASTTCSA